MERKKAIIVDIDGTLANVEHRRKFLIDSNDWKMFKANMSSDSLNVWCLEVINRFKADYKIILVSGREEKYREVTEDWLGRYDISYNYLFLRSTNDFRGDAIIKKEIYDLKIKKKFSILFVLDDRDQVVKMWRSSGLVCLQCHEGNF